MGFKVNVIKKDGRRLDLRDLPVGWVIQDSVGNFYVTLSQQSRQISASLALVFCLKTLREVSIPFNTFVFVSDVEITIKEL